MAPRPEHSRGRTPSTRAVGLRLVRRALAAATLLAALAASPAQALQLGPEAPHSPNAEDISTSYWVLLVLLVLIVIAVNAALVAALLRFRERRGQPPARVTAGRGVLARVGGGLALLAICVFVFGIVMADSARTVAESGPNGLEASLARTAQVPIRGASEGAPPTGAVEPTGETPETGQEADAAQLEIDAIAQQWLWRFEYPSERTDIATVFSYGELVVPVDTTVVLNIDSTDVIHSWWVPALGGQVQAVPGDIAQTWFKADEVGVYEGQGTVFDGTTYPSLRAQVRVVEPAEYEAYLEALATDLEEAQATVRDEVAATAEAQAQAEETP